MYTISAAFAAALGGSHNSVVVVNVLSNGAVIASGLPVISGNISIDETSSVRRTCTVDIVDNSGVLVPRIPSDSLSTYGNELQVFRGIQYSNGTQELVPVGVFHINTVHIQDGGDNLHIEVTGTDRSDFISRQKFQTPFSITAIDVGTAIQSIIAVQAPALVANPTFDFNFQTTTTTVPLTTFDQGSDPWVACQTLAASAGMEVFFDANGVCILRTIIDPSTTPTSWSYKEGPTATFMGVDRTLSSTGQPNGYIVTGEAATDVPAVRGEAWDSNPASPTYQFGTYGQVPAFVQSTLVTTVPQAQAMALGLLNANLGVLESLTIPSLVNPAFEAGDVIVVERAVSGVIGHYVLQSFNLPLSAQEPANYTMRKRTV